MYLSTSRIRQAGSIAVLWLAGGVAQCLAITAQSPSDPAAPVTQQPADRAPAATPAPPSPPASPEPPSSPAEPAPTREEQRSAYRDFRAAFDAKRYEVARPLAERAMKITEQLDGRYAMARVTPLNNPAQTL
ncbi:MAG: hypothetical protein JSR95_15200 [Proteobacteria bacterium]|nr:hypothetical protein [Pseudomonadota bacterium]